MHCGLGAPGSSPRWGTEALRSQHGVMLQATPERELKNGRVLLQDVDLTIHPGELVAIVAHRARERPRSSRCSSVSRRPARAQWPTMARPPGEPRPLSPPDRLRAPVRTLHLELSVDRSLRYAGRLRLPRTTAARRTRRPHREPPASSTSRRAVRPPRSAGSAAVSASAHAWRPKSEQSGILFLDEPTSGLDPGISATLAAPRTRRRRTHGHPTTHATRNIASATGW